MREAGLNVPTLGIEAGMVDPRTYSDAVIKDRIRDLMEIVAAAGRERGKAVGTRLAV